MSDNPNAPWPADSHPDASRFICQTCGDHFTVYPPTKNPDAWENCLGEHCPSYTLDRDPIAIQAVYGIDMIRDDT